MDMNAIAARVKAKREAANLNVRFVGIDGKPSEFSFASVEKADAFRASVVREGREVLV